MAGENEFHLVVAGATAPGIVAAVRAAREGQRVALVAAGRHLGGSLPSLGAVESHYRGVRAPLLQEFIDRVTVHYRERYGAGSEQYRVCTGGAMLAFEPHVAEKILTEWIASEPGIRLMQGYVPVTVEKSGRLVEAVTFRAGECGPAKRLVGHTFVEASDEGDLLARCGAGFRVGREARGEFQEPRAGRVFTQWLPGRYPRAAVEGRLNLVTAGATTSDPLPGSTGEGDDNIQSYSYRLCLTDDPANRRRLEAPPPGYQRESYAPILLTPVQKENLRLPFHHRFLIHSLEEMADRDHIFHGHTLPNRKRSWNATNFTGAGKGYAEAGGPARRAIARRHLDHALGLLWFLQNDPGMPAGLREKARPWGLARDEFADCDNIPPELYVREARRLVGRAIFRETDALPAPGLGRAPVHPDSIGITEFSLDSLACTTERLPGTLCDGQLFQMEASRPGQVPFGCLLPRELDNLLVVTTVSATHVGWGTMRQTPTLMHLAESGAWAAVLAAREKIPLATIDPERLQRTLIEHGVMISFFNDFDTAGREPWVVPVQYLGARGFFSDYDSRPREPLRAKVAAEWARAVTQAMAPTLLARRIVKAEQSAGDLIEGSAFRAALGLSAGPVSGAICRGEACRLCYHVLTAGDFRKVDQPG